MAPKKERRWHQGGQKEWRSLIYFPCGVGESPLAFLVGPQGLQSWFGVTPSLHWCPWFEGLEEAEYVVYEIVILK